MQPLIISYLSWFDSKASLAVAYAQWVRNLMSLLLRSNYCGEAD